ncbi:MAG: diguanylate cyclase [bacterium]|nr:diguanylate cyclase [bacterium]
MNKIFDYILGEQIGKTRNSEIYRGYKEEDKGDIKKTVRIKILSIKNQSPPEIALFKQEYDIIKKAKINGILEKYDILFSENTAALIYEDFDGIPLERLIQNESISIKRFLTIAVEITKILIELHNANIIHHNIKPASILLNIDTGEIKLSDFGISSILTHEFQEIYDHEVISSVLPYISPEQSGRINRTVDYRTDLYSLGVTLYEMATNRVPFTSKDPLEIIHSHIARKPYPPVKILSQFPAVLSDIIMKLLSKSVKERYQSAFGLLTDLENCLNQLKQKGSITNFKPGQNDISIKFNIPQKLYGREKEIELLKTAFDRASMGIGEAIIVSGPAGIGKSTLVKEIREYVTAKRGHFISGKYDQFSPYIPYSTLVQAFTVMIRQILSESKDRIEQWRNRLIETLGPNGKIITRIIPDIELIIGKQPELPHLPPEESQNRFHLVFENFTKCFSSPKHPLVLFMDDVQWIDPASISLLEDVVTSSEERFFVLIGAIRDTEVTREHPIFKAMKSVLQAGATFSQIPLAPLNVDHIKSYIIDLLNCPEERAVSLAHLVFKKTMGNPFFVNQFMKSLYERQLLKVDPSSGWEWDIAEINCLDVTDNVVEFMANKISKLKENSRAALIICASMGNSFDLEALSVVLDKHIEETLSDLSEAVTEGLVGIFDNLYIFHHDRIQEAVYSLIPDDGKSKIHYTIGTRLLKWSQKENENQEEQETIKSEAELEYLADKIFFIVNQLNTGKNEITTKSEQQQLSVLNLMAGKQSKSSAAFLQAIDYFTIAIDLLGDTAWDNEYELTMALHEHGAEAAYLSGNFDLMEQLTEKALSHSKGILHRVTTYEIKILAYMAQSKPMEAIRFGLSALKLLGVNLTTKPGKLKILLALARLKIRLRLTLKGKDLNQLIELPQMTNEHQLSIMRILREIISPSYIASPALYPLIITKRINLSIKYGNTGMSPPVYASYGVILCQHSNDFEPGNKFADLALKLAEQLQTRDVLARTYHIVYGLVRHWVVHVRETIEPLNKGFKAGIETGDFQFASYCLHFAGAFSLLSGVELTGLAKTLAENSRKISQLKQQNAFYYNEIDRQGVLNLTKKNKSPWILIGEAYNEKIQIPLHIEAHDLSALFNVYFIKVLLSYYFGEYSLALKNITMAGKNIAGFRSTPAIAHFTFYDSLIRLALFHKISKPAKKEYLKRIKSNQKKMKIWAQAGPMNCLHKFLLIDAELARIQGENSKAMKTYELAIDSAIENKYIHEEALANELTARFYLSLKNIRIAGIYMQQAYRLYKEWGALSKLDELDTKYPLLLYPTVFKVPAEEKPDSSETTISSIIDLVTLKKALKTIAEEKIFSKMIEKVIGSAMEFAGAQKGFLILREDKNSTTDKPSKKDLFIEAESSIDSENISILQSIPVESCSDLPQAVINFVKRTKVSLVIHDAQKPHIDLPQLQSDEYIIQNNIHSILCIPIIVGSGIEPELVGLLYLENNLAAKAFTENIIETLEIICLSASGRLELSKEAAIDGLTGLYNRKNFDYLLHQEIVTARRRENKLSLIMIDIDHFKSFNDTWGHQVGDLVLKEVAAAIKNNCRESDIVARYGGEEMAVILPEIGPDQALVIAEKIRIKVETLIIDHPEENKPQLQVTISLGVSSLSEQVPDKEKLVKAADDALYISKQEGRNRVSLF